MTELWMVFVILLKCLKKLLIFFVLLYIPMILIYDSFEKTKKMNMSLFKTLHIFKPGPK